MQAEVEALKLRIAELEALADELAGALEMSRAACIYNCDKDRGDHFSDPRVPTALSHYKAMKERSHAQPDE